MTKLNSDYSPLIQDLLKQTNSDWADLAENRKGLVPYGYPWLDKALYGIDIRGGELIVLQGPEKGRKTTTMLNIIANIQESRRRGFSPPMIVVDTLESGMHPLRYRDAMISIMATRELELMGHNLTGVCQRCKGKCKQLGLSPEFLTFNERSPMQETAIANAMAKMMDWSLYIYGARRNQGDTRTLEASQNRWSALIEAHNAKIFVIDHIQQYSFPDLRGGAYELQERVVPALSDLVAQQNVAVFALSQVSLSAFKDSQAGIGDMYATGGKRAAQEANTVLTTQYNQDLNEVKLQITVGRRSGKLDMLIACDPTSGTFYGEPRIP